MINVEAIERMLHFQGMFDSGVVLRRLHNRLSSSHRTLDILRLYKGTLSLTTDQSVDLTAKGQPWSLFRFKTRPAMYSTTLNVFSGRSTVNHVIILYRTCQLE